MSTNEDVQKMHAQILNLRSAGIACATAIHYFPPCGTPESCNRQCPEARATLQEIYESMNDLMLSVRLALAAVFHPDTQAWDFLWELNEESTCPERDLAKYGQSVYSNQDEFIRSWGEMDDAMMEQLGTSFSKKEWKVLTAKGAWQNGQRLPQIRYLLKYVEDQIRKQFDSLFDSVLNSCIIGSRALRAGR